MNIDEAMTIDEIKLFIEAVAARLLRRVHLATAGMRIPYTEPAAERRATG